jgi:CBS domain-containing protein
VFFRHDSIVAHSAVKKQRIAFAVFCHNRLMKSAPSASLLALLRKDLMRFAPFAQMLAVHVDQFLQLAHEVYFAPNEVVVEPAAGEVTHLFYLRQGFVTGVSGLADLDQGAFQFEPGDLFPVSAALAQRAVSAKYHATSDAFLLALPVSAMRDLALLSAPFADYLNRRVVQYLELSKKALASNYSSQALNEQTLETPLGSLIRRAPIACGPETPLQQALQAMADARVGSMLVLDAAKHLQGILTQRDVLVSITLAQIPLATPIEQVMRTPVFSLTVDDSAQQAALLMSRHGIRHVPITRDKVVVGMVSERDLFALQRQSIRTVSSALRSAPDQATLKVLAAGIRRFAATLLAQGVQAKQATALISHLNDLLTQRLVELLAVASGVDLQTICWLALGSEGRMEQTIATDQDNALVFADHLNQEQIQVLRQFAANVNQGLDDCGYPLCKGGIMASNPLWCMSGRQWLEKIASWIEHGTPEDLLRANTFFDLRALAGNEHLAEPLSQLIQLKVPTSPRFLKQLALDTLERPAPLNWIGAIDTKEVQGKATLDVKLQGTAIFVGAARVYALHYGVRANSTRERLELVGVKMGVSQSEYLAWVTGFEFLQTLRLRAQLDHTWVQDPNRINLESLNDVDRKILKMSLGEARSMQQRLQLDFGR